mmetsp:Transcript_144026/g.460962  ORF Transcript_144026/g.460962 Transcript_144026/m.460962 type:complete len:102 (+) Transcript_144026:62-367(+)
MHVLHTDRSRSIHRLRGLQFRHLLTAEGYPSPMDLESLNKLGMIFGWPPMKICVASFPHRSAQQQDAFQRGPIKACWEPPTNSCQIDGQVKGAGRLICHSI